MNVYFKSANILLLIMHSLSIGTILFSPPFASAASSDELFFLSTQLTPFDEAEKMRKILLKDFKRKVRFEPNDNRLIFEKVVTGADTESGQPDLVGGIHGDFCSLKKRSVLMDLTEFQPSLKANNIVQKYIDIARIEDNFQYYIPWMQATYIMVANKKALKYLPRGADIRHLSFDELLDWAKKIKKETGKGRLGFPAGKKGLMHRFLQGCLYPSFTGGMVTPFKSDESLVMWTYFKALWQYVNQWSLSFSQMEEPLLSDEVWIAWDHTARLVNVFKKKPKDFIAFPCPAGPKGRGFMVVLAGLGIPSYATNKPAAMELIRYLTQPDTQYQMLNQVGFFPVVNSDGKAVISSGLTTVYNAVQAQSNSDDAIVAMLPVGLGHQNEAFNTTYMVAFTQIVLREKNIPRILARQAKRLESIFEETQAPCWPPDISGTGSCTVN